MAKDDWLHIRISSDLKEKVLEYAKENNYEDVATLIREIVADRVDPSKRKEQDIGVLIRQALAEDPSILDEPLRRIGVRFHIDR